MNTIDALIAPRTHIRDESGLATARRYLLS